MYGNVPSGKVCFPLVPQANQSKDGYDWVGNLGFGRVARTWDGVEAGILRV